MLLSANDLFSKLRVRARHLRVGACISCSSIGVHVHYFEIAYSALSFEKISTRKLKLVHAEFPR